MTTYVTIFGDNVVPPSYYAYREVTLDEDTQLYWPDNSNSTNLVANIMEVTATTSSLSLRMPPANQVSVGRDVLIRNMGVNFFVIRDSSGNAITSCAPSTAKYVYLTDNDTEAGAWSVFTYGTGTSSADATSLAGAGLTVLDNELNLDFAPVAITAGESLGDIRAKVCMYSGGAGTVYLPRVSTYPYGYFFGLIHSGVGTLTVDAGTSGSGVTIDGASTKTVQPGESLFIVNTGVINQWRSLGYGRAADFYFTQLAVDVSSVGSSMTINSTQAGNKLWYFYNTASGDITVTIPAVASIYFVKVGAIGSGNDLTFTTGSGTTFSMAQNRSQVIYCDGTNIVEAQSVTTGTLAQFNAACTDADFCSLAGVETLTNKRLTQPVVTATGVTGAGLETALTTESTFTGVGGGFGSDWLPSIYCSTRVNSDFCRTIISSALADFGANTYSYTGLSVDPVTQANMSQYTGLYIDDSTSTIPSKGIRSLISDAAGRWNIHAEGTAPNYFEGSVGIGTNAPTQKLDVNGNLAITGTGRRITGDFSNATVANRTMFQTSTVNGNVFVDAIPSGTATTAGFEGFNNSDPTNAARARFFAASTEISVQSGITGTGTYLPMTFYAGGGEKVRIDTSGNVGIGVTPSAKLDVTTSINLGLNYLNVAYDIGSGGGWGGGYNATYSSGWKNVNTGSASVLAHEGGSVVVRTLASSAAGTSVVERMRIDSNGNVGIGTTSPDQTFGNRKLTVGTGIGIVGTSRRWYLDGTKQSDSLTIGARVSGNTADSDFVNINSDGSINFYGSVLSHSSAADYAPQNFTTSTSNNTLSSYTIHQKSKNGGTVDANSSIHSTIFRAYANGGYRDCAATYVALEGTPVGSNAPTMIGFETRNTAGTVFTTYIDSAGVLNTGSGIRPSAASDVLSVYDEGSWTATFTGWTTPPTNISARYRQIGKTVFITLQGNGGVRSAGVNIGGLPADIDVGGVIDVSDITTGNRTTLGVFSVNYNRSIAYGPALNFGSGWWVASGFYFIA
jgi:hypothetical protein